MAMLVSGRVNVSKLSTVFFNSPQSEKQNASHPLGGFPTWHPPHEPSPLPVNDNDGLRTTRWDAMEDPKKQNSRAHSGDSRQGPRLDFCLRFGPPIII